MLQLVTVWTLIIEKITKLMLERNLKPLMQYLTVVRKANKLQGCVSRAQEH